MKFWSSTSFRNDGKPSEVGVSLTCRQNLTCEKIISLTKLLNRKTTKTLTDDDQLQFERYPELSECEIPAFSKIL